MFASICRTLARAIESGLRSRFCGAIGANLARGRSVILASTYQRMDRRMIGVRISRASLMLGTALLAANAAPALAADQAVCTRTSYLLGENLTFSRNDIVQYAELL